MRDIPMFATENGIGSLILKDIPYSGNGYVNIFDASNMEAFLEECHDFCKMAGAKNLYISGKDVPDKHPLHTEIWIMECPSCKFESTDAILVPVDDSNAEKWREIYNNRMADVPTAAFMSRARVEKMLNEGNAYLIYRDKTLLGIGAVSENRVDCIASAFDGAGRDVLLALCSILSGESVELEVASVNVRAISFYRKLGFQKIGIKENWYKYVP